MTTSYPFLPFRVVLQVGMDLICLKHRSFKRDAAAWAKGLDIKIIGIERLPREGPSIVVMNHYYRPGFQAWWFALALAAYAPVDMHWTMTAAWTESRTLSTKVRAVISKYLFPRLAFIYNFTSMPPMPPRAHEVQMRALAVRKLLAEARKNPPPVLALAPEGRDSLDGALTAPHSGVGRLLYILNAQGFRFHPVGVYETDSLVLNCGQPFRLESIDPANRDSAAADYVMQRIAGLLPTALRGRYVI